MTHPKPRGHQGGRTGEGHLDLWFFAERSSRKVAHISLNPVVGVTLTSADAWVSISGIATVVDDNDKAHELWNTVVGAWFPQGPDDQSVVLIKVSGDTAEYWDSPDGRVASVISFAKAKITGQPYDGGENEVVQLWSKPAPDLGPGPTSTKPWPTSSTPDRRDGWWPGMPGPPPPPQWWLR